ncbi:MAG: protein kinase [Gammaproteobacteria bacterium]|nr:protein kinase [Gammaproteobacteria bacterium]
MPTDSTALSDAQSADRSTGEGTVLRDRFVLEEQLEHGRLGRVFRALDRQWSRDDGMRRYVEILVMPGEIVGNSRQLDAFKREFSTVQSLSHPNVVELYDLDRHGDVHFVVMEWVDGESLRNVLDCLAPEPLSEEDAVRVVRGVGEALSHAHARGIAHGDVRADNIIVNEQGDVKLLLASACLARSAPFSVEPRDDVLALAALAYELLSGTMPPAAGLPRGEKAADPWRIDGLGRRQWSALREALTPHEAPGLSVREFLEGMGWVEPREPRREVPRAEPSFTEPSVRAEPPPRMDPPAAAAPLPRAEPPPRMDPPAAAAPLPRAEPPQGLDPRAEPIPLGEPPPTASSDSWAEPELRTEPPRTEAPVPMEPPRMEPPRMEPPRRPDSAWAEHPPRRESPPPASRAYADPRPWPEERRQAEADPWMRPEPMPPPRRVAARRYDAPSYDWVEPRIDPRIDYEAAHDYAAASVHRPRQSRAGLIGRLVRRTAVAAVVMAAVVAVIAAALRVGPDGWETMASMLLRPAPTAGDSNAGAGGGAAAPDAQEPSVAGADTPAVSARPGAAAEADPEQAVARPEIASLPVEPGAEPDPESSAGANGARGPAAAPGGPDRDAAGGERAAVEGGAPREVGSSAGRSGPRLAFGRSAVVATEGQSVVPIELRRNDAAGSMMVAWWTEDGSATASDDYADFGRVVETFRSGERSRTIFIPITADSLPESTEEFYLYLSELSDSGRQQGELLRATVTITDDDN